MTLKSYAQEFFDMDNNDFRNKATPGHQLPAFDTNFVSEKHEGHGMFAPLEVAEPLEVEIVIEDLVPELPGAPKGTKDPEPMLEVSEEPMHVEEKDDNDAKKSKDGKGEKWDWTKHGPHGFVAWIKSRIADVPKHSGYDSSGLERAVAYMERIDNEISKAMRMDLDGELDGNKVESVRSQLDDGIARLQARLDKVKDTKKSSKKRKKTAQDLSSEISTVMDRYSNEDINEWVDDTAVPGESWTIEKAIVQLANNGEEPGFEGTALIKEAQKIMGVKGVMITVPIFISRIARVCVNGTVSAGHDIEDLYHRQVEKWKLTDREQAEVQQLLFDMGYPLRQDRGFMPDDNLEVSDSDNMDWSANYYG